MKRSREPEEEPAQSPAAQSPESEGSTDLPAAKITGLDESALDQSTPITMRCLLPPHREPLSFKTYPEYEAHYSKVHMNRCVDCQKNFPTEHFLNVHIEECHDAFAAVLREKGEHTYSCFVEGCERKCATPQKRRMHLIDKHMYPKNYFFAVTKEGVDGRCSLLLEGGHRRRKSSFDVSQTGGLKAGYRRQSLRQPDLTKDTKGDKDAKTLSSTSSQDIAGKAEAKTVYVDTEMENLAGAMSALQFVPTSVRFGRGRGNAGVSRR